MKNLFTLGLLVLVLILGLNQNTYADCDIIVPNGSGNDITCQPPTQNVAIPAPPITNMDDTVTVLSGGGVVLPGAGIAISTSGGSDTIIVNPGANISGQSGIISGSETSPAGDFIQITGGMVSGTNFAIGGQGGDDVLVISGGTINGEIDMGSDNNSITISGGTINGDVEPGLGTNDVLITGGTFINSSIVRQSNFGSIEIAANVTLDSIGCGGDLILSMGVPEAQIPALSAALMAAGENGELTVNGILYDWFSCDIRIANFQPIVTTITLAPIEATNELLEDHTVIATVLTEGVPEEGVSVTFEIVNGPNVGFSDTGITDANGEAKYTYTSSIVGTDTIVAGYDDPDLGAKTSNAVTKTWIAPRNVPTLSEWGLIAMAGILGIVGFMIIRRRKVTA